MKEYFYTIIVVLNMHLCLFLSGLLNGLLDATEMQGRKRIQGSDILGLLVGL